MIPLIGHTQLATKALIFTNSFITQDQYLEALFEREAVKYWRQAQRLAAISESDCSVVYCLYAHAFELCMKYELLSLGYSFNDLKTKFGHNLEKILVERNDKAIYSDTWDDRWGLDISDTIKMINSLIKNQYFRYPSTLQISNYPKYQELDNVLEYMWDSIVVSYDLRNST